MSMTKPGVFDHAVHSANTWVRDVADAFSTDDRQFAYRVLRAWLHTLRDRLTVEASAHFAAQLPDLVRGIYYEGWDPSRVPEKYDVDEFADRFARAAIISNKDVPRAAAAVASVLPRHLSPGHMDKILDQLPAAFRDLLNPY